MEETRPLLVAVVDDLMFLSRIREAAKRHGSEVRAVRTAADAVAACRDGARMVLFDLDTPRLPVLDSVVAVAGDPALAGALGLDVAVESDQRHAREARAAGCRTVLPRSAFVRQLDELLR